MLPAMLVIGMNAYAEGDTAKGLIGVEAGYIDTQYNTPGTAGKQTSELGTASIGLKVGAESRYYRVFVDGAYWDTDQYNKAAKLGASLQYLIHTNSELFNIFMGVNAGTINTNGDFDPYYGVDLGFNLDLTESFGIEVGARYCDVPSSTKNYVVTKFAQGYVTALFKFNGVY